MIRSILSCLILLAMPLASMAEAPDLPKVADELAARSDGFWRECEEASGNITSRDLFAWALVYCDAKQHPERLDRLFELAEQMQDRDPQSKNYGNFWWSMRDGKVLDANAVDFSMRGGALLWMKHRDFVPAPARERLERLLTFAVQGCLRHKVPESYSNIAIMNAGDLILLGEALGKPEVADEGYARLDRIFRYTQTAGVHEYDSPTYSGVDLDGLGLIVTFCQRDSGRAQAHALLEFFWTDLALNWFPPAQKLAGANSRTYDYPYGLGELDRNFERAGWLTAPATAPAIDAIFSAQIKWLPSQKIHALSEQYPRLVRQRWGDERRQARTHFLQPDITLSSASAGYGGRMDMPLTADLPGDRKSVRCYFIADGRNDPYGQLKLPAGAHNKAFHLDPFWTAAQHNADALGLVIYRAKDIPAIATTLVSNFIMPMSVDSFWIGEQPVSFSKNQQVRLPVKPGDVVAFRKGAAALGLRVPWTCRLDGRDAECFLVYDGNPFGAVRLTIEQTANGEKPRFDGVIAGAAIWVRVGSGLKTDEDFSSWRKQFAEAGAEIVAKPESIKLKVSGVDGPVSVTASAPWSVPDSLEPAPTRYALELNGKDVGSKILSAVH
jgi:hypothetical protein